jgi:hypothetical protein
LSLIVAGSLTNASLGAVSGVVVEVTHKIESGLTALLATHPVGKAGAVTPSKLSFKTVAHGVPLPAAVAVAVAVGVALAVDVAVAVAVGDTVADGVGVAHGPRVKW